MEAFLEANGYELIGDDDAIAGVFEDLGRKIIDQSEFFGWVSNHVRPPGRRNPSGLNLAE